MTTVTINRQDKGNSLAPQVLEEVEAMFTDLSRRQDVHDIVFTGGERYFWARFDLTYIRTLKKVNNENYTAMFHRAHSSAMFCEQPVICAVGGPAIAGVFDLTMMCDIRFASERARFGQREIVLSLNSTIDPLWRIIGLSNAMESALTGRIWDAREALRIGYISRVFPEGKLLEEVGVIAREMATYDRGCHKETKQLTHLLRIPAWIRQCTSKNGSSAPTVGPMTIIGA